MSADALVRALHSISTNAYAAWIGVVAAVFAWWLTRRSLAQCGAPSEWRALCWGLIAGGLSSGLALALLVGRCQETPEVRPDELWLLLRPVYQAALIVLLVAATATDLRTYYILDSVTLPGMAIGVAGAFFSGDLQIIHVWVDWTHEIPQLRGPYIPGWLAEHRHLHGLCWSLMGLALGGGITWLARIVSSQVLGQESLGFGDVTLMGMIGAFIGWQPVLLVFLLAPMCAIVLGLPARIASGRQYLPYGPFLALAAVLVLFAWRQIWMLELRLGSPSHYGEPHQLFTLRKLFGDAIGLSILAGLLVGGLIILLGAWRLYLAIPVERRAAVFEPSPSPPALPTDASAPTRETSDSSSHESLPPDETSSA